MNYQKILGSINLAQIQSEPQFQDAKDLILSCLPQNTDNLNKYIINQYFDDILNIFDNDHSFKAKFYNLLILKEISQNGKHKFMSYLSGHPLLAYLFNMAMIIDPLKPISQKGKNLFRNDPTLGNNYMQLLLECLKFWSQKYQTTKNGQATKFAKGLEHLKKNRVQIPQFYNYVKTRKSRTKIPEKIENTKHIGFGQMPQICLSRMESQQYLLGHSINNLTKLKSNFY